MQNNERGQLFSEDSKISSTPLEKNRKQTAKQASVGGSTIYGNWPFFCTGGLQSTVQR